MGWFQAADRGADPAQPLLAALQAPAPSLALHLPAHGRGRGLPPALRQLLRRRPGSWDLPELPAIGGPLLAEGAVADTQRRCAALFGADHCWLGVNGASGLLQAALLALCPPGSRVLLPRNLHRSLLHACVLGRLQPVLYSLPFDPLTGLWLPADPAHLQRVLAAAPGPLAALVLVDPTYQGLAADLAALVEIAHGAGLPVLVDQAHGDGSAVAAGADLVVLSPQKAAGGLAQGAALLARGERCAPAAIERALLWLQTSSPSALLLASAAVALTYRHSTEGRSLWRRAERRALGLRRTLEGHGFRLVANQDPLRLVLATAPEGFSGLEADSWLMARGVLAELPEPGALTFCLGARPPWGLAGRLSRRLLALRRELGGDPLAPFQAPPLPLVAEPELALGVAWRASATSLPLADAAGRIAAEALCPYPPGIPLLVPGERIDAARRDWLLRQRRLWPGQIADTVRVVVDT